MRERNETKDNRLINELQSGLKQLKSINTSKITSS